MVSLFEKTMPANVPTKVPAILKVEIIASILILHQLSNKKAHSMEYALIFFIKNSIRLLFYTGHRSVVVLHLCLVPNKSALVG